MTKNNSDFIDNEKIFLVDGSGYIFRAYYALPPMTNPNGLPINAVYGFMNMMVKLVDDYKPKKIAVAFDVAKKTFRNEIYKEYKSNRNDPPEDLVPQFDIIKDATRVLGLPILELEGYEADDLIATFCDYAKSEKRNVVIVSSDKDLMQLVDKQIIMLDPMKQSWIDETKVFEKFGVMPNKVIDVQSLAGDTSDNVPGVPGIGIKIASELINQYGNLSNLLSRSNEIKQQKRREKIQLNIDKALISKKLVTLKKDVPLKTKIRDIDFQLDFKSKNLIKFLDFHNFKRLKERINNFGNNIDNSISLDNNSSKNSFNLRNKSYELVTDINRLKKLVEVCKFREVIGFDCETNSLNAKEATLVGFSIAYEIGKAFYVPLRHIKLDDKNLLSNENKKIIPYQIKAEEALEIIKPLLENEAILKVGHNIKFDMLVIQQPDNGKIYINPIGDTMCMSYVLNLGKIANHKLDDLALIDLDYKTIKYEEICGSGKNQLTFDKIEPYDALNYAAEDSDVVLALYKLYYEKLIKEKKLRIYEKFEKSLIKALVYIEDEGIIVNSETLNKISDQLKTKIVKLENKIYSIANEEFNIGSPKQLGEILFDKLEIGGGKRSKNGSWQTSVEILNKLSFEGVEIADYILDWRHFSKLKNTYTSNLIDQINPKTNRIHTCYSMVGTNTGRLSSSSPNLQNIPIRTDEGKLIRTAFEAKDKYYLLSMDYSQIELRLISHIADEKHMIEAFNNNLDIHTDTASKVFNIDIKNVNKQLRRRAKAINFGIIYGISPFGLAKQLKCSNTEAKQFIDEYFKRFPNILEYMKMIKKKLYENGYVETLFGRRIYIDYTQVKNQNLRLFAERQAINAPIQGTAADIIKIAMIKIINNKLSSDVKILLQVHDELLFEVPEEKINETIFHYKNIMEEANIPLKSLKVKLKVDYGYAKNWADAH